MNLRFIAIRNCTVQLALPLYVVSAIGLQHLEKFGTQSEIAILFPAQFPRYSVWGCTCGKLKTSMKEAVGLKTATLLFARKVGVLKLVLRWPGGREGSDCHMYFPYIRSSFICR